MCAAENYSVALYVACVRRSTGWREDTQPEPYFLGAAFTPEVTNGWVWQQGTKAVFGACNATSHACVVGELSLYVEQERGTLGSEIDKS